MGNLSKLDAYDYAIVPDGIRVAISGINDPILVDVLSEISQSDGKIYVEGSHYTYLDEYEIVVDVARPYIELKVAPNT